MTQRRQDFVSDWRKFPGENETTAEKDNVNFFLFIFFSKQNETALEPWKRATQGRDISQTEFI